MSLTKIHNKGSELLCEAIAKLGISSASPSQIYRYSVCNMFLRTYLQSLQHHLPYFPHLMGHYTGMDVHDTNVPNTEKLRPGMTITVEPGLYSFTYLFTALPSFTNPDIYLITIVCQKNTVV